ncbi:hypothetical protein [Arthrobacter sp. OAP107]|uniref:hypothetical protein n=1 Tax=Arthrobacter sp. OAP107 TaxID=3156445 RepID=UPI00339B5527
MVIAALPSRGPIAAFADHISLPGISLPFYCHFFACLMALIAMPGFFPHFLKGGEILLRKIQEILAGLGSASVQQPQFDGHLLDRKREDVYTLMQEEMISLR